MKTAIMPADWCAPAQHAARVGALTPVVRRRVTDRSWVIYRTTSLTVADAWRAALGEVAISNRRQEIQW